MESISLALSIAAKENFDPSYAIMFIREDIYDITNEVSIDMSIHCFLS